MGNQNPSPSPPHDILWVEKPTHDKPSQGEIVINTLILWVGLIIFDMSKQNKSVAEIWPVLFGEFNIKQNFFFFKCTINI